MSSKKRKGRRQFEYKAIDESHNISETDKFRIKFFESIVLTIQQKKWRFESL